MNDSTRSRRDGTRQRRTQTLDVLFDALAQPARRRILTALAQSNPRDDDEFAPEDFATDEERDTFLTSLHHVHLPHLEDAGFVEWDRETETVTRGPRYDEVAPLVELMLDHEDELPADWP